MAKNRIRDQMRSLTRSGQDTRGWNEGFVGEEIVGLYFDTAACCLDLVQRDRKEINVVLQGIRPTHKGSESGVEWYGLGQYFPPLTKFDPFERGVFS
jgi:hypothetical protein